ncbi:hypothetical protein BDFB_006170 [Asbolus verrucosus]|uniref:Uncharacterized protein n=1 Tax=Asbolus verrucosus TaxID=1661398 RepID=A0A482W6G8_ASBVE|nr:hypothetical protein BDFB_006170 [Asbolus verrucosus]
MTRICLIQLGSFRLIMLMLRIQMKIQVKTTMSQWTMFLVASSIHQRKQFITKKIMMILLTVKTLCDCI